MQIMKIVLLGICGLSACSQQTTDTNNSYIAEDSTYSYTTEEASNSYIPNASNYGQTTPYASPMLSMQTSTKSEDEAKEDAAETAIDNLSYMTYEDVMGTVGCTSDCSGHNAGFQWAKDNQITSSSECGGNSASFIEGCEAYGQAIENEIETAIDQAGY